MIHQQTHLTYRGFAPSPLHKISYRLGFQLAKLERTAHLVRGKIKVAKWGARVVEFLGVKNSMKLGWKGFRLRRKVDDLRRT